MFRSGHTNVAPFTEATNSGDTRSMQDTMQNWQTMNKAGAEAAQASASAVARGTQAALAEWTDYSKESFERSATAAERLMSARSFDKAIEVQTGFMRDAYDAFMGRMTKVGEIYSTSMRDAYRPFETIADTAVPYGEAS